MLRRLSVEDECRDGRTCQSVWDDEPGREDSVLIVGESVPDGLVPTAPHERAIRIKRQVIIDARLR